MMTTKIKMTLTAFVMVAVLGTGTKVAISQSAAQVPEKQKVTKKDLRKRIAELEKKLREAEEIQKLLLAENQKLKRSLAQERYKADLLRAQEALNATKQGRGLLGGFSDKKKPSEQEKQVGKSLRHIGLAMHNYHDVHKHLPARAIFSKAGKPLLSWRVAVLPYLDHAELYQKFKLDEPWDSEHNKKLLAEMPDIYAPSQQAQKGYTTPFQVFTGKGTAFEDGKLIPFTSVQDGTSCTVLAAEGKELVPWTKPQDLEVDLTQKEPKLGVPMDRPIMILMCDGSVRKAPKGFDRNRFTRLLTIDRGEAVDARNLFPFVPQLKK